MLGSMCEIVRLIYVPQYWNLKLATIRMYAYVCKVNVCSLVEGLCVATYMHVCC